ncbi:hypothetical protein BJX68DRAFT_261735 [Aspergillus pseudodeflectus]|uniref:GPI anchored cell wall protein n=2 Tax=Aspergillus subgen. Nidulantes TaxID=2720870 RepID=A0A0U5C6B1_ASPCI|nr:hypothetical protein ASPCAL04976 [Aspergillus calidoustus]
MIFAKLSLAAALALGASALPQGSQSTTTSSATPSSSSTPTPSGGGGGITIVNNLNTTVHLWSTSSTSGSNDMKSLTAGGGSSTETWQTTSDGGFSIKMSTTQDQSSVLQFEYTNSGDELYWDLSSIDLDKDSAFVKGGFSATADDDSCAALTCAAGDADCAASYQKPDDKNTHSCSSTAAITLTLG